MSAAVYVDQFDAVHATADVPQSGLRHQQVWRSTLSAISGIQVHSLPGTQDPGTRS